MEKAGYLFYAVNPANHVFEHTDQVPVYITEVIPFFLGLILLEQLVRWYQGRGLMHMGDAITSSSHGLLMEQSKLIFPTFNVILYSFIWNRYRVVDLEWNSLWTWSLALIMIDFIYYWFHRSCHEVNVLWATHQVHHSSEHYNLSTALRQSVPQLYFHALFYLPLAFFLPPTYYLVHFELNTLFQFWIHTELVDNLGPFGIIFNTPSHHRVHHGRNRYCIDKNYGSVLIIWDRMFGTFSPEEEPVKYGLTHSINTFDPWKIQMDHYIYLYERIRTRKERGEDILSILFKGPGWEVGKPRTGLLEDIPEIKGDEIPFAPSIPRSHQIYALIHFLLVLHLHVQLTEHSSNMSHTLMLTLFTFIFLSLTSLSKLLEGKGDQAEKLELIRSLIFLTIEHHILPPHHNDAIQKGINLMIKSIFLSSLLVAIFCQLKKLKETKDHLK